MNIFTCLPTWNPIASLHLMQYLPLEQKKTPCFEYPHFPIHYYQTEFGELSDEWVVYLVNTLMDHLELPQNVHVNIKFPHWIIWKPGPINTTNWYSTCHITPLSSVLSCHTIFIQILLTCTTIHSVRIVLLFLLTHLFMCRLTIDLSYIILNSL